MSSRPPWLPEPADVSGAEEEVIQRLYQLFLEQFDNDRCQFRGTPVRWDQGPVYGRACDRGFWHLVSRENKRTGERELDHQRMRYVLWSNPVISNEEDGAILGWEARERGRLRTYLWLYQWDFVVVLEYRDDGTASFVMLVTAYVVVGDVTRRRLRQRFRRGKPI